MIDTIISYGHKLPGIHSEIFLAQVGGATNRIANDATAYPHRDIQFVMNVHTRWLEANDDAMCVDWARDFYRATKPFATGGAYMNFISEGDDSVESAYGDNALKLAAVKQKYDPDNILRTNLNITPS